jgi:hypothetical protein
MSQLNTKALNLQTDYSRKRTSSSITEDAINKTFAFIEEQAAKLKEQFSKQKKVDNENTLLQFLRDKMADGEEMTKMDA